MAFTLHRASISPIVAAISLLPLVLVYTGCRNNRTLDDLDGEHSPAAFGVPKNHFEYCELTPVVQKSDPSGGLASLEAVLRYWDTEVSEAELANKYPPPSGRAHSIRKLRRIAINRAIDVHRAHARQQKLRDRVEQELDRTMGAAPPAPDRGQQVKETRELVEEALALLNPRYAQALRLRLLEDLDRDECARVLGVTVGNFDVILHRATKAFRQKYPPR